jgi:hypothetical protein
VNLAQKAGNKLYFITITLHNYCAAFYCSGGSSYVRHG